MRSPLNRWPRAPRSGCCGPPTGRHQRASARAARSWCWKAKEEAAPFWQLLYEQTASEATTKDNSPGQVDALSTAPLVIVPLASKDVYLDRYARPEKGWTDRDEARMPIPYWYIDTGFTALLMLLAVEELGAIAVGHPDLPADPVPPARASERESLDELVHRGRW